MITVIISGFIAGMFHAWYNWCLAEDLVPGDMPKAVTIGGLTGAVVSATAYLVIHAAVQP